MANFKRKFVSTDYCWNPIDQNKRNRRNSQQNVFSYISPPPKPTNHWLADFVFRRSPNGVGSTTKERPERRHFFTSRERTRTRSKTANPRSLEGLRWVSHERKVVPWPACKQDAFIVYLSSVEETSSSTQHLCVVLQTLNNCCSPFYSIVRCVCSFCGLYSTDDSCLLFLSSGGLAAVWNVAFDASASSVQVCEVVSV